MPEYCEVLGVGARDEGNTHNNSDCDKTVNLDVANIDKMMIIHGVTSMRQLMNVTL